MKIEVKNKENQRLSMQNEQLQFRLQSQPNLSLNATHSNNANNSLLFAASNVSMVAETEAATSVDDDSSPTDQVLGDEQSCFEIRTRNQKTKLTRGASSLSSQSYEVDIADLVNKNSAFVDNVVNDGVDTSRLRSKSLKMQLGLTKKNSFNGVPSDGVIIDPVKNKKLFSSYHQPSCSSSYSFNKQFRPVSEHFDFNINDRDIYMTRSVIVYDSQSGNQNDSIGNSNESEYLKQFEANEEELGEIMSGNFGGGGGVIFDSETFSSNNINTHAFENNHFREDQNSTKSMSTSCIDSSNNQLEDSVSEQQAKNDDTNEETKIETSSSLSDSFKNNNKNNNNSYNSNQSVILLD